jgi:hypothetical protein
MDNYYVLVTGSGATSRANLEALMEDHYYANGQKGILVLAFKDAPSQGQVFAAQLAKDKSKEVIIFATESARYDGLPSASTTMTDTPLQGAIDLMKGNKASAFILWSDDDQECLSTLVKCKEAGIPCFDLTDGLNAVNPSEGAAETVAPSIPKQEQVKKKEDEEDGADEAEEDDLEEDEEEEEESDFMEDLYFGVQALAKIFAQALIEELASTKTEIVPEDKTTDTPKKPSKGSKA